MKQQNKPTYNGLTFDSVGEMHFYWWCEELKIDGFIDSITNQPEPFELSENLTMKYVKPMKKTEHKVLDSTILREHIYTADFKIEWNVKAFNLFHTPFKDYHLLITCTKKRLELLKSFMQISFIEVKPSFDQNNMTRLAVLNQKWVFEKFGLFINIVIPEKLFAKTFTPKRYLTCDKSSVKRKIKYKNIISLDEFLLSS